MPNFINQYSRRGEGDLRFGFLIGFTLGWNNVQHQRSKGYKYSHGNADNQNQVFMGKSKAHALLLTKTNASKDLEEISRISNF